MDNFEWKGKIKETKPNCIVEGEYKNYKFSGKVKRKKQNGEFFENIYLNGKLWTGIKLKEYDYYCSPKSDKGLFIGEYLNGRKWKGKGKELYPDKKIFFQGEYDKGKKLRGKEYYEEGQLKFEGEYLNGEYYNGIGYSVSGGKIMKSKKGKIFQKIFIKMDLNMKENI